MRVVDLKKQTGKIESAQNRLRRSDASQEQRDRDTTTVQNAARNVLESLIADLGRISAGQETTLNKVLRSFLGNIEVEIIIPLLLHPSEAYGDLASLEDGWLLPDEAFEGHRLECERYISEGNFVDAFIAAATAICAMHAAYTSGEVAFRKWFEATNKAKAQERRKQLGPIRAAIATAKAMGEVSLLNSEQVQTVVDIFRQAEENLPFEVSLMVLDTEFSDLSSRVDNRRKQVGECLMELFALCGFFKGVRGSSRDQAAHYAVAIAALNGIPIKANTWRLYNATPSRD